METLPFSELFGRLTSVAAVVAGALGAAGAGWKFIVWLRDRRLNGRIESATVLGASGVTPALKDFGERELSRLHFLRLTGLDRYEGYDQLLACHRLLGGTDSAWARMRAAGGFLQTHSCSAYVQPLDGRAWAAIVLAYAAGSVLAVAACALLAFSVFEGLAVPEIKLSMTRVYIATMAAILSGSLAMCAFATLRYATYLLDGRTLGQHIRKAEAKQGKAA
jgi:hypothetical protein